MRADRAGSSESLLLFFGPAQVNQKVPKIAKGLGRMAQSTHMPEVERADPAESRDAIGVRVSQ